MSDNLPALPPFPSLTGDDSMNRALWCGWARSYAAAAVERERERIAALREELMREGLSDVPDAIWRNALLSRLYEATAAIRKEFDAPTKQAPQDDPASLACCCIGPQNGEPLCPCAMSRAAAIR